MQTEISQIEQEKKCLNYILEHAFKHNVGFPSFLHEEMTVAFICFVCSHLTVVTVFT